MFIDVLLANDIPQEAARMMASYAHAVLEANEKFNLTRILSETDMAESHFIDSLAPVRQGYIKAGDAVIDIGTGAGFPGVPIAIYEKNTCVTLMDSSEKKTAFVQDACRKLGIPIRVICARAEDAARLPAHFECYDAVTARAVARLNILLELCGAFVNKGGHFLAYKGPDVFSEIKEAEAVAKKMGLSLRETLHTNIPGKDYTIAVYQKIASSPEGYPRRFAKIKSHPLSR